MSQEFEKCTILKDADVSYSASSVQQPASAEVSQVRPWGWIADGRLFHLRAAAIEAAEKTPVIDVYTGGQVTRLQAVNAALQARLTVADQGVDDLQSGPTNARECIVVMSKALLHVRTELDNDMPEDICYATVRNALAHQSELATPNQTGERS